MGEKNIELLAPAKNVTCGIEAILHGADAVYIGAPRYGARAAAGNAVSDIQLLVEFAHLYHARIYVTVNTILKEEELADVESMIWELYQAGVDALIVQDMALLRLHLPPIPLHASTQMHNRSVAQVQFLYQAGFRQVVLPREFTLEEIRRVHAACPVPLEVFVHGSLCVSYSGRCYASQACFGRSANRGECAQFCRLPFSMEDADGRTIVRNKHLLSLKDMNRIDQLEALLDAGVTSFKIEGRLKDVSYVKNVTACYRRQIDAIFRRRKEFVKSSSGSVHTTFTPQLDKSFNRGFTTYFLNGRTTDIFSFDTPKSMGEEMGCVKEVQSRSFTVAGVKPFHNGDGLCFLDESGTLHGFRVNRAEQNRLYPQEMPPLKPHTLLYRSYDQAFERDLSHSSAERKISLSACLGETAWGFTLTLADDENHWVTCAFANKKEHACTPQQENLRSQLGKLGNTPFQLKEITIDLSDNWFIPSSVLAEWRRYGVERLLQVRHIAFRQPLVLIRPTDHPYPERQLTYATNVFNSQAEAFYRAHGVTEIAPAFEQQPVVGAALMTCKHCLRYSMGWCPKMHKKRPPYREPFYLRSAGGRRFLLEFDCRHCQMKVIQSDETVTL